MMKCFVCDEPAGFLTPDDTHPLCSQRCADEILFQVMIVTNGLDQ